MTELCPSDDHDFERTGAYYTCKRCGHFRGSYAYAIHETAKEVARQAALPEAERIDIEIEVRRKEIAELEAKIAVLQERRKSLEKK